MITIVAATNRPGSRARLPGEAVRAPPFVGGDDLLGRTVRDQGALVQDQDAEPSMNAPEAERPDGLDALEDDESMGGDGSPS